MNGGFGWPYPRCSSSRGRKSTRTTWWTSGWGCFAVSLGRAVDATGSPVPIAHALKPRAPRRSRLYTNHIEA